MALRVLLADESSTIKKVMHLALADFGVEVKAVPVGLDVPSVAMTFKPDIIFADILLAKRSGYDVCADIKNDPATTQIPVVLMWSGFMVLDEGKAQSCRADGRLEKPFDADQLRNLVQNLVHKTGENPISSFLSFPEMPEFAEPAEDSPLNPAAEDFEEFAAVPLTTPKLPVDSQDEGGWAHQDLSKFKLNLPESDEADFGAKFVIPEEDEITLVNVEETSDENFVTAPGFDHKPSSTTPANLARSVSEQMMETLHKGSARMGETTNAQHNPHSPLDTDTNNMDKIIREEAREIIESICWKILPEIAERIVREEISKILKETEI